MSIGLYDIPSQFLHLQISLLLKNFKKSNLKKAHCDVIFFLSLHDLHSFLSISDRLSVRFDSDALINLQLSINFSLLVISLLFSFIFLSGTLNVLYFSVFSPKQSILPLNFVANSLIVKW